jgi:hypothetical protein
MLTYRSIHEKVQSHYGPASLHGCRHCGVEAAEEWAYNGKDPNEKTEIYRGKNVVFGTSIKFYIPLCKSCHHKFDNTVRFLENKRAEGLHMRWHVKRNISNNDCSLCVPRTQAEGG